MAKSGEPFEEKWTAQSDGRTIGARFVACLDVLGFKRMVASTELDLLASRYDTFLRALQHTSNVTELRATREGRLSSVIRWRTPYVVFSDTLLLWSDADTANASAFFSICASLVSSALQAGMPLRGGIALGEAMMDKREGIYLGQALVDAHLTEASQDWIGIGLHESCCATPEASVFIANHEDVVPYAVPTKPGCPAIRQALRWHDYAYDASETLQLVLGSAPKEAHSKYENTRRFVAACPKLV